MSEQKLDPRIEWLFELPGPELKWELDTARSFCGWLGNPQRMPRVVHVGGTNGKGSVAAFVHAIGRAAGLRCGLFTSPHLVCPTERIAIDGQPISMESFFDLLERLRIEAERALAAGAIERFPSFFEMMTAIGFVAFAEAEVDLAVVEVGLGGRLDATNVVDPEVAIITTIGLDHVKSLGGSLRSIAFEKAGIAKPGVPLLAGFIGEEPLEVIARQAQRRGARLCRAAEELEVRVSAMGTIDVETPETRYERLRVALLGEHQRMNAALALRAAELLRERSGLSLPDAALYEGLARASWPGRLELVGDAPALLLDAAHNLDGIAALSRFLEERDRDGRPERRVLVFGLTLGRDPEAMLTPLARHVDEVLVVEPSTTRALDAEAIARGARSAGLEATRLGGAEEALAEARRRAGVDGEVLVAGSLYLVGDVRAAALRLVRTGHPRREQVADARRNDAPRDDAEKEGRSRGAA